MNSRKMAIIATIVAIGATLSVYLRAAEPQSGQMPQMQEQMQKMQEQMATIHAEQDPAKREGLMRQLHQEMQEGMRMMGMGGNGDSQGMSMEMRMESMEQRMEMMRMMMEQMMEHHHAESV